MKEVQLANGGTALVDDEDFIRVAPFNWRREPNGYASAQTSAGKLYLHRVVLGVPQGVHVDHHNGAKLDCRRENLRTATMSQNAMNQRLSSKNTSGYKGVSWDASRERWMAQIRIEGHNRHLGRFRSAREAALAYDSAARREFGPFARVNFPRADEQGASNRRAS